MLLLDDTAAPSVTSAIAATRQSSVWFQANEADAARNNSMMNVLLTVPATVIVVECSKPRYCSNVDAFRVGFAERIMKSSLKTIPTQESFVAGSPAAGAEVYGSV